MNSIQLFEIRRYEDWFKEGVIRLISGIQQKEFGLPVTMDSQPDLQMIPSFYQTKHGNFWIAVHRENVIGTIALLDLGNSKAALRKMFVDSDWKGSQYGVAQELLNTLIRWASEKSFKEIFLGTTEKFKAAHRFYEKNGFNEMERSGLPADFPMMEVDVKFYVARGF